MLTDLEAAKLCQAVYAGQGATFSGWLDQNGITVGLLYRGSDAVVVFRGTADGEDWLRDVEALPQGTPDLGFVHAGFFEGMREFYNKNKWLLTGNVTLTGHSLGAARAVLMAGLMAADGKKPARVALFGCPRPGGSKLMSLVRSTGAVITSYCNWEDPVPEVPYLPWVYTHLVDPPTSVQAPKKCAVDVEDHFIIHYVEAMQAREVTHG